MPDDLQPFAPNERAQVGGNRPPLKEFYEEQNQALPFYLEFDNADLTKRTAELMAAFERMPEVISDAEMAGKFSDQIAQIGKCIKAAESKREDIKSGPLTAGRTIDGFFQREIYAKIGHPKDGGGVKATALARLTVWEQKVAAEEKRRREEEERRANEAAAEAERIAQAERDRVAKEAETAARLQREAEAKIANEQDLEKALAMEAEQKVLAVAREAAARTAAEESEARRAEAERAAAAANAKASDMATVRGGWGSSSSLRTIWKGRVTDYDKVDLNALRGVIGRDVIDRAANAHAKIHKKTSPVTGIEFYEDTSAVVRG